jgi:formate hydrogenlyase subunit 3/multisubunit Na+/H+ antiporter MnhD subunit
MTAPVVWVIFPCIVGIILLFLQKFKTGVLIAGIFVTVNLSLALIFIPIEDTILVGTRTNSLSPLLNISELKFVINNSDRSWLFIMYALTLLFMGGAAPADTQPRFVPLSLLVLAFINAAISFSPSIYGILFFLPVILLCVFILSPPGSDISKGGLRFLIFQIIGIAFVLYSGGMIVNNPDITENLQEMKSVSILLGVGFLFLFAVFPVYTWITKVAEDSHPFTSVYVFLILFGGYALHFSAIMRNYPWLIDTADVFRNLTLVGMFLVATGGAWSIFQQNLARILGYAVVIEFGYVLMAIGIQQPLMQFAILIPGVISLAVWALGLAVLRSQIQELNFKSIQGLIEQFPYACSGILAANFTLAGMPLLAGFPILILIWSHLARISPSIAIFSLLGSAGLLIGGLRSLAVLMMGSKNVSSQNRENIPQKVFLFIGVISLVILGIFPHWIVMLLTRIIDSGLL